MTLRDAMVYHGVRTSKKLARLTWFERDFFYGLLNAADQKGRFEADAELLRPALYAPLLSKVTERDVQGAMIKCHGAGLIKLWTGDDGRGFGEVINYRQTGLKNPKSAIPAPPGSPPEPDLFTGQADPPGRNFSTGKKEEKSPQPPAEAGGGNASPALSKPQKSRRLSRLPKLDTIRDELTAIEREMTDILRPGGCAFAVQPTDPQKKARLEKLFAERERMTTLYDDTKDELVRRSTEAAP